MVKNNGCLSTHKEQCKSAIGLMHVKWGMAPSLRKEFRPHLLSVTVKTNQNIKSPFHHSLLLISFFFSFLFLFYLFPLTYLAWLRLDSVSLTKKVHKSEYSIKQDNLRLQRKKDWNLCPLGKVAKASVWSAHDSYLSLKFYRRNK